MKDLDRIKGAVHAAHVDIIGEAEATQELADKVAAAVQDDASAFFGAGVYVKGKLNYDMGGVSYSWKRPSIGERLTMFEKCALVPVVNQDDDDDDATKDDTSKAKKVAPGARQERFNALVDLLKSDDFTSSGAPSVDALNDLIEEGEDAFDAKERDLLWKECPAAVK